MSNYIIDFRATCEELLKEYKACESPDYISYASTVQWKYHPITNSIAEP